MRLTLLALALLLIAAPGLAQEASSSAGPSQPATDRAALVELVRREAVGQGVPPELAEAVAEIESGYSPSAVGGVGEIGLMQIRPPTAEMLGHSGGALGLFDPATNARFAVRYLAQAWRLAGGDVCRALMKYRAGHREERMTPLSSTYCARAKAYLAALGSPLAAGAGPVAEVAVAAEPTKPPSSRRSGPYLGWRPGRHTAADNERFWAAHEARIRALEAKIAKTRKLRLARG
ncbi:lytic transglycosylase domain-containing protein [Hansschlegelia sp.]|uniref:lytic transglycosylase domain-containing protein n=1 Tax=Hansschlegelia sp. TaxID=2041892 RepID=UPI002BEF46F2|nr:transglycosylase SLT domain-containing protein [Hansschlegelia sp.]HVI29840.1 transglycosylase SLT domain-containing protein [Hansschlegelia sp.]